MRFDRAQGAEKGRIVPINDKMRVKTARADKCCQSVIYVL